MFIGSVLCLFGALADSDPCLMVGAAFLASAGLQAILIGWAQAAEPAAAGEKIALPPSTEDPQELAPRAT